MDFKAKYLAIIEQLKKDIRPQVELSKDDVIDLCKSWDQELNEEELKQILCILDHTKYLHGEFGPYLIKTLKGNHGPEILIYTLGSSQRHIITKCGMDGVRVPKEFVEALRHLLKHHNAEVLEWNLRIIEQLGGRGIILKADVLRAKPNFLGTFNPHKKAARQIISMLEKRWQQ